MLNGLSSIDLIPDIITKVRMFQTSVLASGSKGNCVVVRSEKAKILIDAGLSGIKIWTAMDEIGLTKDKIKALFITHDHSDHIKGAGIVARKLNIPLYMTEETFARAKKKLGKIDNHIHHFEVGESIHIDDLIIESFPSSHDAVDSCNFVVRQNANDLAKLAVCTDLGYSTRVTLNRIAGATTLILESNHDEIMLLNGPYPWELKQRVRSNKGHLSNKQAVGVINSILHKDLKNIILAHLSEENNTPILAEKTSRDYLDSVRYEGNLFVAGQYNPLPLIDI